MTSGVKIRLRPRTFLLEGALSSAITAPASSPRARACRSCRAPCRRRTSGTRAAIAEPVDPELALDQLRVRVRPLARDAVDPERLHLPGDVDRPVVHRVAETGADVAADDDPAALHHEPGHRAGRAADDDRAALLVDPAPRADASLHDDVAAAERRRRQRARRSRRRRRRRTSCSRRPTSRPAR